MVSAPKASVAIAQIPKSAGGMRRGRMAIDTAVEITDSTRVASMACVPERARAASSSSARSSRRKQKSAGAQPGGGPWQRLGQVGARPVGKDTFGLGTGEGNAAAEGLELVLGRRGAHASVGGLHEAPGKLGALVHGHDLRLQ